MTASNFFMGISPLSISTLSLEEVVYVDDVIAKGLNHRRQPFSERRASNFPVGAVYMPSRSLRYLPTASRLAASRAVPCCP